jgi:formate hydrogenlyase subunit 3/multisubunit Na+/H+ antiporter MnhD subunit
LGLILVSAGLSGLRARNGGDDDIDTLRGLGRQAPWSTAALIFGGLSMAGLPVSAGFVWRWALCRALAPSSPGSALLVLLASVGVIVGVWRGLAALLMHPRAPEDRSIIPLRPPEGWLTAAVVSVTIIACVGVGLFPQVLTPFAVQLAEAYTFFTP